MVAVLLALVASADSFDAYAQEDDWDPDTHRSGAGVELYPWSSDLGFHTAFIGFANIGVTEEFYIDVFLPFSAGIDGPGRNPERAGLGNPGAAFRYAPKMGIVRWWIGGGFAAPLASVDDADWNLENGFAAASMAFYQPYHWAEDFLPLYATGGADIRVHEYVSIQVSGEPIVLIEVDDTPIRDSVELVLQNRVGAEVRHPDTGLGGGLHFKVVYVPTEDDSLYGTADNFQASIEPHFAYTGESFFVRFGLLFALDRPLGPAFDDGRVFSQHAIIGGSW
jgi:hypothetical protein